MKPTQQVSNFISPYLAEALAILFGVIAMLAPSFAYQIIGLTIGIYGLIYGVLFAFKLYRRLQIQISEPTQNFAVLFAMLAIGILLILIPITILKQTISVLIIIGLLGVATYHLYFVRKQYVNPLTIKNYVIGIGAIALAFVVLFFINETSDLVMRGLGVVCIGYSGYRILRRLTQRP